MTWDEPVVDEVRGLAARGHSASEIGRAIGRTRNAVLGKCFREGIMLLTRPSYIHAMKDAPVPPRARRNRAGYVRAKRVSAAAALMAERAEAAAAPSGEPLPFQEIGFLHPIRWPHERGCRHMEGEPSELNWCNVEKAPHSSYCAHHRALHETPHTIKLNNSGPVRTL